MASNSQPYRLAWDGSAGTLEEVNRQLNEQISRIDYMFQELYDARLRLPTDYQKGTWTPILGGLEGQSGQQYFAQVGQYVKIGSLVIAWCYVGLSTKGTISSYVAVRDLPFVAEPITNSFPSVMVPYFGSLNTAWTALSGYIRYGTNRVTLRGTQAAATSTSLLIDSDIKDGTELMLCAVYSTSS